MTTTTAVLSFLVTFVVVSNGMETPCTTPDNRPGRCVPLNQCSNLYAKDQLYRPESLPIAHKEYVRKAECRHNATTPGVCCVVEKIFELPEKCGPGAEDRISKGEKAEVFEFPWMALLMYSSPMIKTVVPLCGGSVISDRYVLSAAHCFPDTVKLELVRLGEHTISTTKDCNRYTINGQLEEDCAEPVQDVPYESLVIHQNYHASFDGDDIALIRLARKIDFKKHDHIKPICLPMSVELKDTLLPQYIIAGWGLTEKIVQADVLQKAKISRIERDQCRKRFDPKKTMIEIKINEQQICAGGAGKVSTCQGDSGGPLMWRIPSKKNQPPQFVQFGVVSFGTASCGVVDLPAVYTRVGSYLEWIVDNMKA